jgi:lipopolysaccharide transport system permease protein
MAMATTKPSRLSMNPHTAPPASLPALAGSLWQHRHLIMQMTQREIAVRYRGSAMGLAWSVIHPVLMLAVYTFVFSIVFKSRWGETASTSEFALSLFAGLILFNLFSDCINKAPTVIPANINYVKKVIFPLEILPMVSLASSLFQWLIAFTVWLAFYTVMSGLPSAMILLLPLVIVPLVLCTLGCSWILASLGVYLKDVAHLVGFMTSVLLFLSPVFYPLSAIPPSYQPLMMLNPLTITIEQARSVMLLSQFPNWHVWGLFLLFSLIIAWLGFALFQKTRRGFADVL